MHRCRIFYVSVIYIIVQFAVNRYIYIICENNYGRIIRDVYKTKILIVLLKKMNGLFR